MKQSLLSKLFSVFREVKESRGKKKKSAKKYAPKQPQDNSFIEQKMQSMKDSQGNSDFSGSGYNGPGNVDHEKRNSNMAQRNF